jgi:hypothetical protein
VGGANNMLIHSGMKLMPTKPYQGIFRANSKIYYSNGKNAYCQYKDLNTFTCMTGKSSANPYPVKSDILNSLDNHGVCRIPARCGS